MADLCRKARRLKALEDENPRDLPLNFHPAANRDSAVFEPPRISGPAEAGVFRLHSGMRAGCASRIHQRDRDLVADCAMRPNLIVVSIFSRASARVRNQCWFKHSGRSGR